MALFHSNGTGVPSFLLTMAMAKYLVPMPIGVWSSGPSQNGASPSPTRRQVACSQRFSLLLSAILQESFHPEVDTKRTQELGLSHWPMD
uniref:Uncharacterized protein n=1 Tax=Arundo donax TaxID=35708 RepID=A0A0A9GHJ3_ARUDO